MHIYIYFKQYWNFIFFFCFRYTWYWGSLKRTAAQKLLTGKPNGSFLVRDSETDNLQFTLSFRSAGVTLHSRINYRSGYWHIESSKYESIGDLFEDTIRKSEEGFFCYVTPVNRLLPPYVVRLTMPITRCFEVPSLQYLCKFVIRSKLNLNILAQLALPSQMMAYIEDDPNDDNGVASSSSSKTQNTNGFSKLRWTNCCNHLVLN